MFKPALLAVVAALSCTAATAADYFVVVPVKGRTAVAAPISVALSDYALPDGVVGSPYAGFSFQNVLTVTGDPTYTGQSVTWALVSGALPAGLTLDAHGAVAGTPTAVGSASFGVQAAYKTKTGRGTYAINVLGAATADLSTSAVTFDAVTSPTAVGASTSQVVRLTNNGTAVLNLTAVPATSGSSAFRVPASSGTTCGATLSVGGSCDTTVQFSPSSVTTVTGSLAFATSIGPKVVPLTGTGLQAIGAFAASAGTDFGTVSIGSTGALAFTFTNSGNLAASGVYASVTGADLALGAPNTCGTAASPTTVAANGGTCTLTVTFNPQTPLTLSSAVVTLTSAASGAPFSKTLTGSSGDASFANVSLLLHGDTASVVDSSNKGLAVSKFGNATVSSSVAKFGGSALTLDGSGDYFTLPSSAYFGFGTGDFTIEAWVNPNGAQQASAAVLDFRAAGGGSTQAKPTIFLAGSAFSYFANGVTPSGMSGTVSLNAWHHVAYSRTAGVGRLFVDGAQVGANYADSLNYGASADLVIGEVGDSRTYGAGYFKGGIDDVRVTKGVGRYTTNFSVPAVAFPNQ